MATHNLSTQRKLDIMGQTGRLNRIAIARTNDTNAARLLVHGVIARALDNEGFSATVQGLDAALMSALNARTI